MANTPTIRSFEGGSFRDRDGRVFYGESGEVLRALSAHALAEWEAVAASRFYQRGITDGGIVATERVEAGHVGASPADGEWAAGGSGRD